MNICRPDHQKSCAACCGLYNVADATRPSLERKLENRTLLFRTTERSPDALEEFKELIQAAESASPLEEIIHVCEFTGFLDQEKCVVGCMLHPCAPGNGGIDLRGMCHYGSMACKMFYCSAWNAISPQRMQILVDAIQDWHLYGLVVTDVEFVGAVFYLLESALGGPLDPQVLRSSRASAVLWEMLSWKDSWPFRGKSTQRRSRYYFTEDLTLPREQEARTAALMETLRFTFDLQDVTGDWKQHVSETVERFVGIYPRP